MGAWADQVCTATLGAALALTWLLSALWGADVAAQSRFERGWNAYLSQGEVQALRATARF